MSKKIETTAFEVAGRLLGMKEVPGNQDNPFIVWCLSLVGIPNAHDEIAWCSAFANAIAHILGLPRSKLANARSWLRVGTSVSIAEAEVGNDIVILKRGTGDQPGPEVLDAPGHVGFFGGVEGGYVKVRGGNQHDSLSDAKFPVTNVLGIRRLA